MTTTPATPLPGRLICTGVRADDWPIEYDPGDGRRRVMPGLRQATLTIVTDGPFDWAALVALVGKVVVVEEPTP